MIVMAAPFNAPSRTITMRSPELADSFQKDIKVTVKMAQDGTLYSKRRTVQNERLVWKFKALPRAKAVELADFLAFVRDDDVRLIDFNGVNWRGKLLPSSYDFATSEKGLGGVIKEYVEVDIEFEGARL